MPDGFGPVDCQGHGEHGEAGGGEHGADRGRGGVAVPGRQDEAAELGADRVGDVERGVVAGRGQALRVARHVHQPGLQRRQGDEPLAPMRKIVTAAVTGWCAVTVNSSSTAPAAAIPR